MTIFVKFPHKGNRCKGMLYAKSVSTRAILSHGWRSLLLCAVLVAVPLQAVAQGGADGQTQESSESRFSFITEILSRSYDYWSDNIDKAMAMLRRLAPWSEKSDGEDEAPNLIAEALKQEIADRLAAHIEGKSEEEAKAEVLELLEGLTHEELKGFGEDPSGFAQTLAQLSDVTDTEALGVSSAFKDLANWMDVHNVEPQRLLAMGADGSDEISGAAGEDVLPMPAGGDALVEQLRQEGLDTAGGDFAGMFLNEDTLGLGDAAEPLASGGVSGAAGLGYGAGEKGTGPVRNAVGVGQQVVEDDIGVSSGIGPADVGGAKANIDDDQPDHVDGSPRSGGAQVADTGVPAVGNWVDDSVTIPLARQEPPLGGGIAPLSAPVSQSGVAPASTPAVAEEPQPRTLSDFILSQQHGGIDLGPQNSPVRRHIVNQFMGVKSSSAEWRAYQDALDEAKERNEQRRAIINEERASGVCEANLDNIKDKVRQSLTEYRKVQNQFIADHCKGEDKPPGTGCLTAYVHYAAEPTRFVSLDPAKSDSLEKAFWGANPDHRLDSDKPYHLTWLYAVVNDLHEKRPGPVEEVTNPDCYCRAVFEINHGVQIIEDDNQYFSQGELFKRALHTRITLLGGARDAGGDKNDDDGDDEAEPEAPFPTAAKEDTGKKPVPVCRNIQQRHAVDQLKVIVSSYANIDRQADDKYCEILGQRSAPLEKVQWPIEVADKRRQVVETYFMEYLEGLNRLNPEIAQCALDDVMKDGQNPKEDRKRLCELLRTREILRSLQCMVEQTAVDPADENSPELVEEHGEFIPKNNVDSR